MKCVICQTELKGKQRRFCSNKCKQKDINQRWKEYDIQRNKGLDRKKELVEMKGGSCSVCGYDKSYAALTFHHRDPSVKEIRLDIRGLSNRKWSKILEEVEKCDLVCFNCHMEIHWGENGGPCQHPS